MRLERREMQAGPGRQLGTRCRALQATLLFRDMGATEGAWSRGGV